MDDRRTQPALKTLNRDLRLADRVGPVRRTLARILLFVIVFVSLNFTPPLAPKIVRAATFNDTSLDFDAADEADFIQENATHTRFTSSGAAGIGQDTVFGGVTAVSNVISSGAYSTVTDDYVISATGTITSWRVYSVNTTSLKLKAYRKNGSNNYTLRADSSLESVTASSVNGPFTASMSVETGDRIGLYGAYNPYRTTGGASFFGWNNGGDFTGTGGFANSNGAFSHPNVEFTLTQYSTAQPYYVTTSDDSQVKAKHWTALNGVTITQTTPGGTSIKYLVSFDGRATWKYWNGSAWTTAAGGLDDLQASGMSEATLEGLSSADWESSGGFTPNETLTIDFAIDFSTSDPAAGPSVDQISFSYDASADTSLDFDLADEGQFIQEDAANGTDFSASGTALLHLQPGATQLYDLSGGTGGQGGQTTYTAADGTTVVSSAATYNSAPNYYMQYMFDGSGLTGTPGLTQYWLTSSSGNQTLTFTLPQQTPLDYVRVYPYTRADAWSQYSIAVSTDASTWTFVAGSGNAGTGVGTTFTHTSQGSAGDNFDYQIDGTYRYVKFTLTQQGSWGVTLNEVQIYENVDAYPLTGYYVTTSDANQLATIDWTTFGRARFGQTTPTSTSLKYLVSFDDRATWKYWDGSGWSSSALGSIGTNGVTAAALEALGYDDWEASGGFQPGVTATLDFAVELKTTDQFATPEISSITVEYSDAELSGTGCHIDGVTSDVNTCVKFRQTRVAASALSDHEILATTTHGTAATGRVSVIFAAGYDVSAISFDDVDLAVGNTGFCESAVFTEKTLSASPSGATWGVSVNGQEIEIESGTDVIAADRCVRVRIGTNATVGAAGDDQVVNPSTPGFYHNSVIVGIASDHGEGGSYINDSDQVTVSADVNATMTFDIDIQAACGSESAAPYAVALGSLAPSAVTTAASTICLDLDTNASKGAVVTVQGSGSQDGLESAGSGGSIVTAYASGNAGQTDLLGGTAGYGLCVESVSVVTGSATAVAPYNGVCDATGGDRVGGVDSAAPQQILTTNAAAVDGAANGTAAIRVKASPGSTTPAANDYTDVLTFIAVSTD